MPTTVVIAGLTGKFVQYIVRSLQAYSNIYIRGYCRSPEKLPHFFLLAKNIKIIKDKFDDRAANYIICLIFFWGTGKETWDLIIYKITAAYTAAVVLDKSVVRILKYNIVCNNYKIIFKIKDCFNDRSIKKLYMMVLDLFRKSLSDVMSWALK
ncbi:hypothetical protein ASPFODRAFT_65854 [Aspergillus luchuensis CBS 106.47]|uniref:NAD(P)-binding domain-containing protein n=1 Tax=Aspergillus luchuensis (strain CBS 106.47) TaxID=1137211 RepID=A0A1M3T1H3_ASPLC|nr:hypothetical protein ASPFODRAFT_65854 [Aspergillus luchuensis CBS 106.47]